MAEYDPNVDVYTEVVEADISENFTFIQDVKLQEKTATQNGVVTPDAGKDGLSKVTVAVPNTYTESDEGKVVSNSALVEQTSTTKNANGTYDTTLNDEVVVNVPNSYTAADEGKVVQSGALVAQTSQTITENGTYDTTTKNSVNVNVPGGGGTYSFCKGIHFDGASYIDTGIAPQSNTSVSIIYSFDDKNANYFSYGARTQGGYDDFSSYYETSSVGDGEGVQVRINAALNTGGNQSFGRTDANTIIHIVANAVPKYATALGSVKYASSNYRGCNKPIFLGGFNDNGVVGGPLKGVVYGFSIDRGSAVQMNLLPCVRNADSKAGFYDTVSGQFYGNASNEGTLTPVI